MTACALQQLAVADRAPNISHCVIGLPAHSSMRRLAERGRCPTEVRLPLALAFSPGAPTSSGGRTFAASQSSPREGSALPADTSPTGWSRARMKLAWFAMAASVTFVRAPNADRTRRADGVAASAVQIPIPAIRCTAPMDRTGGLVSGEPLSLAGGAITDKRTCGSVVQAAWPERLWLNGTAELIRVGSWSTRVFMLTS